MPKKRRGKKKNKNTPNDADSPAVEQNVDDEATAQAIMEAIMAGNRKGQDQENHVYKFWETQPVPDLSAQIDQHGPLDEPKTVDQVRQNPLKLNAAYEWYDVDMTDEKDTAEIYELLNRNYVEDDDNMFRFDYSQEFLRWALMPPGWRRDWHVAIRVAKSKKLVAFISAIPVRMHVYDHTIEMVEINFLCIHKKLRSKRLAPVLIREITRRVNLTDRWQAAYTAGVVLPKPVSRTRYYHRSLNPRKLIDVGFSHLPPHLTMASTIKLYRVPQEPEIPGIRALEEKDVEEAAQLVMDYLQNFDLHPEFDPEEFAHWFLPRDNVISSYVVEDPNTGRITDFLSFYTLCSTIIGHQKYNTLRAAYSFYNVATSCDIKTIISDSLVFAKANEFDVYNALDVMENGGVFKELKFGIGDGHLQYYLFNWGCPEMSHERVGLVLL